MRPAIKIEGGQVFYTYSIEEVSVCPRRTFLIKEWKASVFDPNVVETGISREVKIDANTAIEATLIVAAKSIMPDRMAKNLITQARPALMKPGQMHLLDWNGKPQLEVVAGDTPAIQYVPKPDPFDHCGGKASDYEMFIDEAENYPDPKPKKPSYKCEECKDTGEYDCPFKGKVPCSQGCSKPGHAHIQDNGVYFKTETSRNYKRMVFDDVVPDDHVVDEAAVMKWFTGDFMNEIRREHGEEG